MDRILKYVIVATCFSNLFEILSRIIKFSFRHPYSHNLGLDMCLFFNIPLFIIMFFNIREKFLSPKMKKIGGIFLGINLFFLLIVYPFIWF